jgi:hypothetical protein
MNLKKRLLAAAAAAGLVSVVVASSSEAYTSNSCSIGKGNAHLSVTRYVTGNYDTLHMTLYPGTTTFLGLTKTWVPQYIKLDNVVQSGGTKDLYRLVTKGSAHQVLGYWRTAEGDGASCYIWTYHS